MAYCTEGFGNGLVYLNVLMNDVLGLEEHIQLFPLLISSIVDMYGDVVSKLRRDLFEREPRRFRKEEVHGRNEDHAPTDDQEIVLPADIDDSNRRRLQQDDGGRELPEE